MSPLENSAEISHLSYTDDNYVHLSETKCRFFSYCTEVDFGNKEVWK